MPAINLEEIANSLDTARLERKPIAPPSTTWPGLDADGGFGVQKISVTNAVANGDRLVGYKLGNIAKVMQEAFGLGQPDYGHLLASQTAYENTALDLDNFIEPFVELEPAFVLRRELRGPNITVVDVINAIDLPDTLADNGSVGAVIVGGTPRRLTDLTLRDTRGVLRFNDREVIAGTTANILGNPLAAVAWLVNRLAEYDVVFEPGQLILPGSCLKAVPMREVGRWSGTFEGFGTVEFDVIDSAKS